MMMTQCRLERNGAYDNAFIDARLAQVGRVLNIRENDEWSRGWWVISAGASLDDKVVQANERNWKTHRKGSDF